MHPVNALKSLVMQRLKALGLSKAELATKLGYSNVNKGMRRVDALLDAEFDEELTQRVAKVLFISKGELRKALSDQELRKAKEVLAKGETERSAFSPSITLITAFKPQGMWSRLVWSRVCVIPLSKFADAASWEEERAEVVHQFYDWLEKRREEHGSDDQLSGFYYHQTYDHGYLFDRQGRMIREDHYHVSRASVFVGERMDQHDN